MQGVVSCSLCGVGERLCFNFSRFLYSIRLVLVDCRYSSVYVYVCVICVAFSRKVAPDWTLIRFL